MIAYFKYSLMRLNEKFPDLMKLLLQFEHEIDNTSTKMLYTKYLNNQQKIPEKYVQTATEVYGNPLFDGSGIRQDVKNQLLNQSMH